MLCGGCGSQCYSRYPTHEGQQSRGEQSACQSAGQTDFIHGFSLVSYVHAHTHTQRDEYSTELEQCRGELAAAKVQLATTQDHLKKTKKEGKHFESNLKQTRVS